MESFYSVIERNEMEFHRITLADKVSLESYGEDVDKIVLIYEKREDIARLCRLQEKILRELTGRPVRIRDEKYVAIFRWNNTIGVVGKKPMSERGWVRYFNMDPNASCAICMEYKTDRTICANCTVVICIDCRNRIEKDVPLL